MKSFKELQQAITGAIAAAQEPEQVGNVQPGLSTMNTLAAALTDTDDHEQDGKAKEELDEDDTNDNGSDNDSSNESEKESQNDSDDERQRAEEAGDYADYHGSEP